MVHVILRHLLYRYFVTRITSHDTLLVMLLDTIFNDLQYILITNLCKFHHSHKKQIVWKHGPS